MNTTHSRPGSRDQSHSVIRHLHSLRMVSTFVCLGILCCLPCRAASAPDGHLLGPTGMIGTAGKKDIKVSQVATGSPADGKITAGDVIIGVAGKAFDGDPRRQFIDAINQAETREAGGRLKVTLKGNREVELGLKALGSFSATAPWDCEKTNAIVTTIADQLLASKDLGKDPQVIDWLGLMATGEAKYLDVVKRELPKQEWMHPDTAQIEQLLKGETDLGYVCWRWGYQLIAMGEYHLMTGDKSVLPAIKAYSLALARGQDPAGIWGHRLALDSRGGRLPGYSHINQPSLSCWIGMLLAKRCGIDDPELVKALEKCHAFYRTFVGKGAIPYGVHDPFDHSFNNNGMSGSAAIGMSLAGDVEGARFFSRQVATAYDSLEQGHASYFFNVLWSPLGANVAGPDVSREYNKRSRWLYTSYRSWDGQFTHDGGKDKGGNSNGALLLNYCISRQQLILTGKQADRACWAKPGEAVAIVDASKINYAAASEEALIAMFGHEAPPVRRSAVWELRKREGKGVDKVEALILKGNKLEKGSALGFFGYQCPPEWVTPRIPLMAKVLNDRSEDMEVRVQAAASLACLGEASYPYYNDVLRFIIEDKPQDPLKIIEKDLSGIVVAMAADPYAAGLVKDKDLFYAAVDRLSRNPRQNARGNAMQMIQNIPLEDFHRVGEQIKHVVLNRDRSYHSYHNPQSAVQPGVELLARLHIREGLEWGMRVMDTEDGKGSFKSKAMTAILKAYGVHAKDAVAKIKQDPAALKSLADGKGKKDWNALMKVLESEEAPKQQLISFEEAMKAGK